MQSVLQHLAKIRRILLLWYCGGLLVILRNSDGYGFSDFYYSYSSPPASVFHEKRLCRRSGKRTRLPDLVVLAVVEAGTSSCGWSAKGAGSSVVFADCFTTLYGPSCWNGCLGPSWRTKTFSEVERSLKTKVFFVSCRVPSHSFKLRTRWRNSLTKLAVGVDHTRAPRRNPGSLFSKLLECRAWHWIGLQSSDYSGGT